MPLQTQFQRANGELVSLHWGWWHLDCFSVAFYDEHPELDKGFFSENSITYSKEHTFTDETDGEVMHIFPGDTYHQSR